MITAYKALSRYRFKTLLIFISLTVSMTAVFMISAISSGVVSMYSSMLKTDGDIIVTQKGISDTFFSDINVSQMKAIMNFHEVKSVSAMIVGASPIEPLPIVAIYGISISRQNVYHLTKGDYPKEGEVMLGAKIAQTLGSPHEVTLAKKVYRVSGTYESSIGFEDGGVIMTLEDAGRLFHKSSSFFLISLNNLDQSAPVIKKLNALDENFDAKTTDSFIDSYNQFKIIQTSSNVIGSIAFLMGLLGIASMMSMVVNERKNEFGIMRAIGIGSSTIIVRLLNEAFLIAILAFVAAWDISEISLMLLKNSPSLQGYISGDISIALLVKIFVLSMAVTAAGAIFPALYAAKTDPMILIKQGCQ